MQERVAVPSFEAVLFAIQGVTTPSEFMSSSLVPHCAAQLESFIRSHRECSEVAQILDASADRLNTHDIDAICQSIRQSLMNAPGGLHPLVAPIAEDAFLGGAFRAASYPDTPAVFRRLNELEKSVFFFDSLPVKFQRMVTRYSFREDLSGFVRGFFDTEIGAVSDSETFSRLARFIHRIPERILFICHDLEQGRAAAKAGLHVALIDRKRENGKLASDLYEVLGQFFDISLAVGEESKLVANS